jgi:DNA-binding transcriptional LysR family regulator
VSPLPALASDQPELRAAAADLVDAPLNGLAGWLGVRLQHLVALETVVQTGSFVRAAAALGYSQSAVSQQIAALESVAGGQLLERGESLSLTNAGEIALRRARAIRREFTSLHTDLDALVNRHSKTTRIVTQHPAATRFLSGVLDRLTIGSGHCVVANLTSSIGAVRHALGSGHADLALVATPPAADEQFAVEPLFKVPLEIVVTASRTAEAEPLSISNLAGVRLLCLNDCPATEMLLRMLVDTGIAHEVVVRADDEATLVQLVRAGVGAALLPSHPDGSQEAGVIRRGLVERCAVVVSAVWCVDRPPAEGVTKLLRQRASRLTSSSLARGTSCRRSRVPRPS